MSADLDEIIRNATAPVIERASAAIAKAVAELVEERVSRNVARPTKRGSAFRGRGAPRRQRRNVEMTAWTADRRARRVPNFVIEATGLDTKKKIVAKFGENVTFHKGKPLPAPKQNDGGSSSTPAGTTRRISAKPPRIRKATG
jgi:hypothetical protein